MTTTLQASVAWPTGDLKAYERAVQSFPLLSAEEEVELATRYRTENDVTAAWRLVTSHLRFVVKLARSYEGYGLPKADIIQEGNVGLMKAVKRFDPSLGVRLVSFAIHHIKAEIHEYVLKNWRMVKIATGKAQRKLFYKLKAAKKQLGWVSASEAEEIAETLGVNAEDVIEMDARLHSSDLSFEGAPDQDDEFRPAPVGYLADSRYEPLQLIEEADWEEAALERLGEAMSQLDARSRDIVQRRWIAEPKTTLQTLADEYGVSVERIRQIEKSAIGKLRACASPAPAETAG